MGVNIFEFRVLEATNIAAARYRRPGHDFEATSAQIALIAQTRYACVWARDGRCVASQLRAMAKGQPRRREPLVEMLPGNPNRWRLTDAGARVLNA